MRRSRILATENAESVADSVLQVIDELGWEAESAIPGLIFAVISLADHNDSMLDEAANLLADGG